MICFHDRAFCGSDCVNRKCSRNLTPEFERDARRWWEQFKSAEPVPIAYCDFRTGCNAYESP